MGPLPNGRFMAYKWGFTSYLLTGMILQVGGGFRCFLFSPLPGEMIPFDQYLSDRLKPPTSLNFGEYPNQKNSFQMFCWVFSCPISHVTRVLNVAQLHFFWYPKIQFG